MGKISDCNFQGYSGDSYSFEVFTSDTSFNNVDAVYIFTRREQDASGAMVHFVLYIGETDDLKVRIENHEKWSCAVPLGCNCICVHRESSDKKRLDKETDLRRKYNPPCNKQ